MNEYLLYNGAFHKNAEPLIQADNRGLRYGDGLFETMRMTNDIIHFKDWHFERLFKGLQQLQFELPANFTHQAIARQVMDLCKKNKHPNARVRINIVRGNGGLYDVVNHFPNWIIQSWALPNPSFTLNENGLVMGIYDGAKKAMDSFANIKSNNYLPYTMGALHAKKNKWNDALILNTAGKICDATIANVFIIKNKVVYTCPLTEGCVEGIIRRYLLETLSLEGFNVKEQEITVEDLLAADEVFLTNAVKGVRWVRQCDASIYSKQITTNIFKKIVEKLRIWP